MWWCWTGSTPGPGPSPPGDACDERIARGADADRAKGPDTGAPSRTPSVAADVISSSRSLPAPVRWRVSLRQHCPHRRSHAPSRAPGSGVAHMLATGVLADLLAGQPGPQRGAQVDRLRGAQPSRLDDVNEGLEESSTGSSEADGPEPNDPAGHARVLPAMSQGPTAARIAWACNVVRSFLAWPGISSPAAVATGSRFGHRSRLSSFPRSHSIHSASSSPSRHSTRIVVVRTATTAMK